MFGYILGFFLFLLLLKLESYIKMKLEERWIKKSVAKLMKPIEEDLRRSLEEFKR